MNSVVVKKCKAHRTGIRWLSLAGWFAAGAMGCCLRGLDYGILLYLPAALIFSPLYIYYEHWSLIFSKEGIERIQWGHRRYSWNDVREVTSARSKTDGEYIRIQFRDQKAFQFRMEDENAEKAMKLILRHTSIKKK